MNKWVGMGRLTKSPDVRRTEGAEPMAVARFTLAIDRRYNKSEQTADFISCVAFGKKAEFAERYLKQGTKICVEGRIQTGSYTNKEGQKVYTTEVVVDNHEFCESKAASDAAAQGGGYAPAGNGGFQGGGSQGDSKPEDGFMNIPDSVEDLPFGG